ncbi:hypothetical protein L9F63_011673, partial [Diploptera punctata]
EGQAKTSQGIKADIPQYIINKLGLNRDPIAGNFGAYLHQKKKDMSNTFQMVHFILLFYLFLIIGVTLGLYITVSELISILNSLIFDNQILSTDSATSTPKEEKESKVPSEDDFEIVKLISNGAYGAVYLVRLKETHQRFAMKKISKNNLMLRNQVDQVFAERDIMSFTDNPFVVSMYCSFETK